jgi:hypothetical protein
MVMRNDTYGAYLFDRNTSTWNQIVTHDSMPAADGLQGFGQGVYELKIGPSNTSHFYMHFNGHVFSTLNEGATWTRWCSCAFTLPMKSAARMPRIIPSAGIFIVVFPATATIQPPMPLQPERRPRLD